MTKLGVYAGTFDPITNGHLWMIEQGSDLFDKLIVAIGINPQKQCVFSLEDRLKMIEGSIAHLPNVSVCSFTNEFLVNYAHSMGAKYILRGIRNETDYAYERTIKNINGDLNSDIVTIFLIPPRGIAEVSSSMVKELAQPNGWENVVKNYVPEAVLLRLKKARN